jgi:hypothetical protein
MERREMYTHCSPENLIERYHLGGLGIDGRIILKYILKE